jgi:hypothetical protein
LIAMMKALGVPARLPVPRLARNGLQVGEQQVALLGFGDVPGGVQGLVGGRPGLPRVPRNRMRAGQCSYANARSQSPMPFSWQMSRTLAA